jgi:hypothetical protein
MDLVKLTSGRVVDGRIVVDGDPLQEGAVVTILAPDSDPLVELSETEEAELRLSIEEAERGDTIAGDDVLRSLRHRGT